MGKQLSRSAVRVYGALSALGNQNGNLLESLLPFFDPILRQYNGQKLDPDAVAAAIRETYRWNFNTDLVETFIPYLVRQGWILPDIQGVKDTSYTIQITDNGSLDASAQTVEADLRRIATLFKEFSETLSPLTALPRGVEEFEDILVEWLLYVEAFSEKSIDFKEGFKADASGRLRHVVEVPNTTFLRDEEKFLCARFVKHAIETDPSSAEVLARIAAIGLLTEVVQDFVKPVTSVDKTDLIVYLDAPVAMELLGISGKLARENTAPVVAELIRIGASVRIFGQSLDEIKNSLQAVLKNPRPTGPTAQALLRKEVIREFVVEASRNPARLLEALGVRVAHRTREQTPSDHKYFTKDDWKDLFSKLSYSENPTAREHDTDIATFVIRQRHGKTDRDIFKSQVLVLTRNGLLAQIMRRVHGQINGTADQSVPPIVHRRVLATALWLRTGMGASDLNIPKRMLLATCEHVLAIRPGVVEAVKRLTDALGDSDRSHQLDLLISQDRSVQALMDKTLGVSNVVTEENLASLWQEMLHPHLEEERRKGSDAVNQAKEEGKKRLDKAHQQIKLINKERDDETASAASKLAVAHEEDRDAVIALCGDVEATLRQKRNIRIAFGLLIGLLFSLPLLLDSASLSVKLISFLIGWVSAYLSATGGKFFSTSTDETTAFKALNLMANRRRMLRKLEQFDVSWAKDKFVVASVPALPSGKKLDLFGPA
ncbi:hypothetical protein HJA86_31095 [Rhizobium bangladeshense]|nr:hypothetical protein [Rhizobium bangladeshense]